MHQFLDCVHEMGTIFNSHHPRKCWPLGDEKMSRYKPEVGKEEFVLRPIKFQMQAMWRINQAHMNL
jgi:hypothetical protein